MPQKWVIGVGSPHGNDQVGWLVADALWQDSPRDFRIVKVSSPVDIISQTESVDCLWLCDACVGGSPEGTVWRWTWPDASLESRQFSGTHDFDLCAALRLAEKLGKLPKQVVVWGVEIQACEISSEVSAPVMDAIPKIVQAMRKELQSVEVE